MCGEERGGTRKAMGRRREDRRQEWVEDEAGGGKAMRVRGGRCGTGHGERRRNREGTGDGWPWRRDNRKIDATCTKRLFQCVSARLDFFSRFFKGCKKQKPCPNSWLVCEDRNTEVDVTSPSWLRAEYKNANDVPEKADGQ